jgi:hypothetical protein
MTPPKFCVAGKGDNAERLLAENKPEDNADELKCSGGGNSATTGSEV